MGGKRIKSGVKTCFKSKLKSIKSTASKSITTMADECFVKDEEEGEEHSSLLTLSSL